MEEVFYNNTVREWLLSLAIILGAMVLNKGIVLLNKHIIQRLTSKTNNRLDDILFKMLEAPVLLGITLFAIWIAANRLQLSVGADKIITVSFKVLTVLNITWFVARLVNALIEEYLVPKVEQNESKHIDNHLMSIIRRTILIVIWALGIVTALGNAGYNVATIVGGLGLGGLAFALAAQDTIKNIFGGITIFSDRPFRIGDRIRVDGFDGFVEEIGIRSTRIRTLEKRLVTIPNYKIVEASVENISDEPLRRVVSRLSLTYNTTPEKMNEALAILKDMPKRVKMVDGKEVIASFTDFSDFALIITYIYYIKKNADFMEVPSLVNTEILDSFNKAGIQFAFPTHTVYIASQANGIDTTVEKLNVP